MHACLYLSKYPTCVFVDPCIQKCFWLCFRELKGSVDVPVDDFLSWPPVCDEKWETAVSEVTQWLLVPTWGQMTSKCLHFYNLEKALTQVQRCLKIT